MVSEYHSLPRLVANGQMSMFLKIDDCKIKQQTYHVLCSVYDYEGSF